MYSGRWKVGSACCAKWESVGVRAGSEWEHGWDARYVLILEVELL